MNRKIEASELPYCLSQRIGVLAYSPLFRGLLSGKYDHTHVFSDSRKNLPEFSGERFTRILKALDSLRPMANGYSLTLAQLAVRWILTHPALTAATISV